MVNNNYISVNNNFSEYIINICRFRFFWDTLYNKSFHAYFNRGFLCWDVRLSADSLHFNEYFVELIWVFLVQLYFEFAMCHQISAAYWVYYLVEAEFPEFSAHAFTNYSIAEALCFPVTQHGCKTCKLEIRLCRGEARKISIQVIWRNSTTWLA